VPRLAPAVAARAEFLAGLYVISLFDARPIATISISCPAAWKSTGPPASGVHSWTA
jgi:hypothetical protein